MQPHRIAVKVFANAAPGLDLAPVTPIFHQWIRDHVLGGLLIDVADYKHVPDGPGIVIIGHEGDYGLDSGGGRLGMLHTRKRGFADGAGLSDCVRDTLRETLIAAEKLQAEKTLAGKLQFGVSDIEVAIQDRRQAANTEANFAALRGDVEAVLAEFYGSPVKTERASMDARNPLTFRVTGGQGDLAKLLSRAAVGASR